MPGPSQTPFYPSQPPPTCSNVLPNHLADNDIPKSPSDEGDFEYPSISNFFEDLTKTESGDHYFTDYILSFQAQGYYQIDQLADESLTVEHMLKMIELLKDGTARVIKKRAVEKVRRIHKGKPR